MTDSKNIHKPKNHLYKISRKREKQTRYLSQAVQLEEAVNPHIIRSTMVMVSLAIIVFLVWSGFTHINELARTPGEVVPYGYQQSIQHFEGGIVKHIHVQEGDIVTEGQVLVSLDDNGVRSDLERVLGKQSTLEMEAERLRAFVEGRQPDFSSFKGVTRDMIVDQNSFFEGMRTARSNEEQIIRDQIIEKTQSIAALKHDLEMMRENYFIAREMNRRKETLNQKGYMSDIRLLEDHQKINDIKANMARLENKILVGYTALEESENRLASLSAAHQDEAYEKLALVTGQKAENIELVHKMQDRINRLEVRSPSTGLVKGLAVNTVGAVVKPGQTLMEIVPLDKHLEVQVKISPQDIGHVKIGQSVQVKFSSYDFSRYGSVNGKLEHISATTFVGEKGERYYQGRISLEQKHVGNNEKNLILPGMTVMADIITGEKTILQYLLKPIHLSLRTAFTER